MNTQHLTRVARSTTFRHRGMLSNTPPYFLTYCDRNSASLIPRLRILTAILIGQWLVYSPLACFNRFLHHQKHTLSPILDAWHRMSSRARNFPPGSGWHNAQKQPSFVIQDGFLTGWMRCNAGDYPESPAALHCSASFVQHCSSRAHVIPSNTPGHLTSSVLYSRHGYLRPLVALAGAQSRAEHSTEPFEEQKQPLHVASANILSSGLVPHLEALVASSGALGPVVFALTYGLATAAFLPAAPLSIASGYLFGPLLGIPVASVASAIGCALSFTVSRYIARPLLEPHLKAYPDFGRIDRAIAHRAPGKVVFLLRLSPIIPLTLLSYILGLTSITFWPYLGASWAGLLPITAVYVLLGGASKGALQQGLGGPSGGMKIAMVCVGVLATYAATKLIQNIAGDALASGEYDDEAVY